MLSSALNKLSQVLPDQGTSTNSSSPHYNPAGCCHYFYLAVEETNTQKLNDLPKVVAQLRRAGCEPQLPSLEEPRP